MGKKDAVKREKKSPTEKSIADISKQIKTFNQIHGTDYYIASASDVEKELRVKAAMTYAFSEQFCMDKVQILLSNDWQFGETRLKRFGEGYIKLSDYFKALEKEDGNDEFGVAHTTQEFETVLQQATKSLYVDRDRRYSINVYINGQKVPDVETKDWSKD